MSPPGAGELIRVFGRIGLMSFGGPAAQIALMHRELVEERPWLDEQTFLRALSLCMLLPGPEAMQLATYAGWRLRGIPGGLIAGGLFVVPGAIVIALLVWLYATFGQVPLAQAAFTGIKAAVIAIVLQALRSVARRALTSRTSWSIAFLAFLALFAFNVPFPFIILAAATWGWVQNRSVVPAAAPDGPTSGRPFAVLSVGLILWLTPLAALSLTGHAFLSDIGWFFAKLAVVTFGGAYAVLAYMTQTVVADFGWITTSQMIDALGLAETTPGPLILVTQFVAMLTGYLTGGPVLAMSAGLVALWATFVPCFLWIFLAGPYLDRIATRPKLSAALQAITAAVVGVILSVSVWFALHVLFRQVERGGIGPVALPLPDWTSLNPVALALTALAALLMFGAGFPLARLLVTMAAIGAATYYM